MKQKNNMAEASMIVGILSILLSCCCMGLPLGGLAVVFACLSRVEQKFEKKARVGLTTGILGMVLGVVAVIIWISIGGQS